MAYLGQTPLAGDYRKLDDISSSFDDTEVVFNLTVGGLPVVPGVAQALIISVAGIIQEPITAYTVSGSTITFTGAPATGATFFGVMLGSVGSVTIPADDSVTAPKIATGAVTATKLANTTVTASTYGGAGSVSVITVDDQGRLTAASNVTVVVANTNITGNIIASQIAPTGVTASLYGNSIAIPVITVDQQGRITTATTAPLDAASTGKAIAMAMVFGG